MTNLNMAPKQERPASLQLTVAEQGVFNIVIFEAKVKLYIATTLPKII